MLSDKHWTPWARQVVTGFASAWAAYMRKLSLGNSGSVQKSLFEAALAPAVSQALSKLWMAVLRYDWGGKAVRRTANSPPELQQLLSDPHVKVGLGLHKCLEHLLP